MVVKTKIEPQRRRGAEFSIVSCAFSAANNKVSFSQRLCASAVHAFLIH
jgi:hypothetical protein